MDNSPSSQSVDVQPSSSTNASAIADLLGDPTAQQQPVVSRSRRKRVWLLLVVPLVIACAYVSPSLLALLPDTEQTTDLSGMPVYTVEKRNLEITVTEEGSLVSDENVNITCDVAGGATIIWLVEDGDRVTAGMDIVKLDASVLSENATAQKIAYEKARALMIQADKDYAAAKIAVEEYREGLFKKELRTAESNVTAATERLQATQNTLAYGERMFRKGYITPQQLEAQKSAVARAKLDLGTAEIALDVLTKFTKPKMTTELESVRDSAARGDLGRVWTLARQLCGPGQSTQRGGRGVRQAAGDQNPMGHGAGLLSLYRWGPAHGGAVGIRRPRAASSAIPLGRRPPRDGSDERLHQDWRPRVRDDQ